MDLLVRIKGDQSAVCACRNLLTEMGQNSNFILVASCQGVDLVDLLPSELSRCWSGKNRSRKQLWNVHRFKWDASLICGNVLTTACNWAQQRTLETSWRPEATHSLAENIWPALASHWLFPARRPYDWHKVSIHVCVCFSRCYHLKKFTFIESKFIFVIFVDSLCFWDFVLACKTPVAKQILATKDLETKVSSFDRFLSIVPREK